MKKTIKYLGIAFGLLVIVSSCEKNGQPSQNGPRTFTFELPANTDSRVSLASDGKTAWEAGDQIFIHGQKVGAVGEEYYSRIVTLSESNISADKKTATFYMDDIVADKSWGRSGYAANLFAAYPASAVASYSDGDSWYYSTGFSDTNKLLLAGCNNSNVNDGHTFKFYNLSGALSFIVDGDFDSYIFEGKAGDEVLGYDVFSVRVDCQNSFGDKNVIPYPGGSGGIATSGPQNSVSGPVTADGSTTNFIYLPGGANLSDGFIIKFLKGGSVTHTVSTSTAKDIAVGKYLNLGDITSHLKEYDAPSVNITIDGDMSDWDDVEEFESTQNSRIRLWKFTSDADNVYFYFKLRGDRLGKVMHIAFDTDNDESTGSSFGNVPGADVKVLTYPVTNGTTTFVSGYDPAAELNGTASAELVYCAGGIGTDSEGYVELSIARSALGLTESGASISVGCAYDWYVTGKQTVTLK